MPHQIRSDLRNALYGQPMTVGALRSALERVLPTNFGIEVRGQDGDTTVQVTLAAPPEVGLAIAEELQALMPLGLHVSVSTLESDRLVYGMGPQAIGRTQAYEYSDVTITIGGERFDGLERVTYDGVPAPATAIKAAPKKAKVRRVSRYELISEDWLDVG